MKGWDQKWFDAPFLQPRQVVAWRGVEAQHVVSTMRLVDTPHEQDVLEQLLEGSKAQMPPTRHAKHYLLVTPFRYNPHHASRFRPAHAKGQWYGAVDLEAACAEVAYWRHRFIQDSTGLADEELLTEHTFFQGAVSGASLDLMAPPWVAMRERWTHGSDYAATQALSAEAQGRGVQWLQYESARAPGCGCVVVFDPEALFEPAGGLDSTKQTWHCKATGSHVMFTRGRQRWGWVFPA